QVASVAGITASDGAPAFRKTEPDVAGRLVVLLARSHWPYQHRRVERVADLQRLCARDHTVDDAIVKRLVYDEPRAGRAGLAGIHEGAVGDGVEAAFEIGVRHDERRKLAAAFERDLGEPLSRPLHDADAGGRAAGEGDLVDAGMVDQCFARGI